MKHFAIGGGYEDRVDVGSARRRTSLAIAAGVVVLGVVGYAAFELTGQATRAAPAAAQAPRTQRPAPTAGKPSPTARTPSPGPTATEATHTPAASPQASPLTPVRAESFGPNGTADGDNPQLAPNVLTNPAAGWRTQWYATAAFGQLKPGTGLMLDMGATVTIAGVTAQLGPLPGAVLQLRVAQAPDPAAFRTVGAVTATSGTATLSQATPTRARYVLLWCTRLPPNGTGAYQLFVHGVTVEGHP